MLTFPDPDEFKVVSDTMGDEVGNEPLEGVIRR
jgi:GGDEF domain-containing protein